MNSQYEVLLNYPDLNRTVALSGIISNLEKIDQITDEVYGRINQSLGDKKTRLENLNSRLFRISSILQTFEKLTKAITIKSAKYYPSKTDDNSKICHKSIYFNDVTDFNQVRNIKSNKEDLNTKPSNLQNLGKNPEGNIDDLGLNEELLKCVNYYNDLTKELDLVSITEKQFKYQIEDSTKMFTNCFDYFLKSQVYSNCDSDQFYRITTINNIKDPTLVPSKKKFPDKPSKKEIDQPAPISVSERRKLDHLVEENNRIRRPTKTINFDIPTNLGLAGLAEIDMQTNQGPEDYFQNKTKQNPQEKTTSNNNQNLPLDDFQDYQIPLDVVKNYNLNMQLQKKNSNNNIATSNINNNLQTNTTPTKQVETNSKLTPSLNTSNTIINPSTNSVTLNQTPYVPSIPIVVSNATIQSIVKPQSVPNVPKIPNIPSVPTIPTISKVPNVPIAPVNKVVKKEEVKPISRGALLDEIKSDNPMARLKKVDTIKTEPVVKKGVIKAPAAANPHDLLKQAIAMRFKKLNKNKHDGEEEDD